MVMELSMYDIQRIFEAFDTRESFLNARPFGSGHINDTYLVECRDMSGGYVLQRINHHIFKDVPGMMNNIRLVTEHIRQKLIAESADDIERRVMTIVPAANGELYHRDSGSHFWRMFRRIEGTRTYDVPETAAQIYQAGKAFGTFTRQLGDIEREAIIDTIPDFHNGPKRYAAFEQALANDSCNRAAAAGPEIAFLQKHGRIFDILPKLVGEGLIPVRITHNDTKVNNVMIDDETGEGLCVIDLDTVMAGLAAYDFGDIMRTAVSPTEEDETDLSKIGVDISRFEPLAAGFLDGVSDNLNETERHSLVLGGEMITLIMGTRFLTDFLAGDVYYKIHRPGHNLDRCRTQLRLVASMLENEERLNALIERLHAEPELRRY